MGFLDKVFTSQTEQVDVEDFLNNMNVEEEVVYEDADAYVKSITLKGVEDVQSVERELKDGNLILLNIEDMQKRNAKGLRDMIVSIKDMVTQIDGDVAGVAPGKILITPARVKIAKRKASQ
ncbi:MAG: cell division protein SepF [Candidatus Iainarchaeum archaeon]|uniref:Cell division protein SepF n=1 Tax=Candidatus Iainarchaeum sp. TaxID=3101447 RepID=A0A7T9DKA2_9ARCH|nr:MAG: cell division protein SepF [Candidatus Diapherotrites archaeon]